MSLSPLTFILHLITEIKADAPQPAEWQQWTQFRCVKADQIKGLVCYSNMYFCRAFCFSQCNIIEELSWKESLKVIWSNSTAMNTDTYSYIRLLRALPSLTLGVSRDGLPPPLRAMLGFPGCEAHCVLVISLLWKWMDLLILFPVLHLLLHALHQIVQSISKPYNNSQPSCQDSPTLPPSLLPLPDVGSCLLVYWSLYPHTDGSDDWSIRKSALKTRWSKRKY